MTRISEFLKVAEVSLIQPVGERVIMEISCFSVWFSVCLPSASWNWSRRYPRPVSGEPSHKHSRLVQQITWLSTALFIIAFSWVKGGEINNAHVTVEPPQLKIVGASLKPANICGNTVYNLSQVFHIRRWNFTLMLNGDVTQMMFWRLMNNNMKWSGAGSSQWPKQHCAVVRKTLQANIHERHIFK